MRLITKQHTKFNKQYFFSRITFITKAVLIPWVHNGTFFCHLINWERITWNLPTYKINLFKIRLIYLWTHYAPFQQTSLKIASNFL